MEAITYFRLQGNQPENIFSLLSDQNSGANDDPIRIDHDWSRNKNTPWTDGVFEIGISITDNSKNRANINSTLVFPAGPEELFTFTQSSIVRTRGVWPVKWKRTYWKPVIDGYKGLDFTSSDINATKLHIHAWDLTEYSNIWTIEIKELDTSTEYESETSSAKKYNTNVEVTSSFGDKIKTGLKYGASSEESNSETRTLKWVEGADLITKIDVPFSDRVLNRNPCNNQLYPKLYTSSSAAIEMRPVQVEF